MRELSAKLTEGEKNYLFPRRMSLPPSFAFGKIHPHPALCRLWRHLSPPGRVCPRQREAFLLLSYTAEIFLLISIATAEAFSAISPSVSPQGMTVHSFTSKSRCTR